jgi:predicted peptidase
MNRFLPVLFAILFFELVSCVYSGKSKEISEAVSKTDTCKSDSQNTYEVYIPERNNTNEKLPLFIIIDAHGNGAFAMDKFKLSARNFPAVLVASNLVKKWICEL